MNLINSSYYCSNYYYRLAWNFTAHLVSGYCHSCIYKSFIVLVLYEEENGTGVVLWPAQKVECLTPGIELICETKNEQKAIAPTLSISNLSAGRTLELWSMEFLLSMLACPMVLSLLRQPGLCNLVDAASIIFPGDSISQQTSCSSSTCNISSPSLLCFLSLHFRSCFTDISSGAGHPIVMCFLQFDQTFHDPGLAEWISWKWLHYSTGSTYRFNAIHAH